MSDYILAMKYLEFKLTELKPKTEVHQVLSKHHGDLLGTVKWFPKWRQYCFFPNLNSDFLTFSSGCLSDIIQFLEKLNEMQKLRTKK